MNKILLIIQREYLTRVRKKSFLIMSILGPILFGALLVVPIWLATMDGDDKVVDVIDESGLFAGKFEDEGNLHYNYLTTSLDEAKKTVVGKEDYGLLYIPALDLEKPEGITFYSEGNPSFEVVGNIRKTLKAEIRDLKLRQANIDQATLDRLDVSLSVNTINMSEKGETEGNVGLATGVGYFGSFMVYMFIFIYGVQVMRGVVEEKNNRIVEVIVSSVKPFQLMCGKILGVAAVGLTQFMIWVFLTIGIYTVVGNVIGTDKIAESQMQRVEMTSAMGADEMQAQSQEMNEAIGNSMISKIMSGIESMELGKILFGFLFFFLGGYLLYSSLFAAVGSAVDQETDAQQFMFPVTIPLILSIVLSSAIINDPNGTVAFWCSIIPFTSPVTMMIRLPFGVPTWQLLLSMGLLIGGFIFTTWLAGRIYRIGILMHGSKVNYKTLGKWLFMK
jgi:ABC-2 type transport system permease protein